MDPQGTYQIEIYLPSPIDVSALVVELRRQWSETFGGTTSYSVGGTYRDEPAEPVTILRVFVPKKHGKEAVVSYFAARKAELKRRFPEQQEFLVTFSDGPVFL